MSHSLSLGNVLAQAACPVALLAGKFDLAERYIAMFMEQAATNALDVWRIYGRCFRGMLRIGRGDVAGGVLQLGEAVDELRQAKFVQYLTAFLLAQAEGAGRSEASRAGAARHPRSACSCRAHEGTLVPGGGAPDTGRARIADRLARRRGKLLSASPGTGARARRAVLGAARGHQPRAPVPDPAKARARAERYSSRCSRRSPRVSIRATSRRRPSSSGRCSNWHASADTADISIDTLVSDEALYPSVMNEIYEKRREQMFPKLAAGADRTARGDSARAQRRAPARCWSSLASASSACWWCWRVTSKWTTTSSASRCSNRAISPASSPRCAASAGSRASARATAVRCSPSTASGCATWCRPTPSCPRS